MADHYRVNEDLTLDTEPGPLISADFDSGEARVISFTGAWDYLDRIENSQGAGQSYPTDGAGRAWNSPDFDPATSTIGPWGTVSLPAQGGVVDAFAPATPDLLQGLQSAPGGLNLVTTYLFRNTFTLTAAEAAETFWTVNLVADDGCVIYLNGVRVASLNMPEGPVTTETFAMGAGNESTYSNLALEVGAALVEGLNTIAVELHQATLGSSDVGLDLTLLAGPGASGGFVYADDVFGTNRPEYANGVVDPVDGFSGGGLLVRIGGIDSRLVPEPLASSGGFTQVFTLGLPATVDISLRYRLLATNALEADEYGEAILEVNGIRYGRRANDSLFHLADGGGSGWQTESFSIPLEAGVHLMTLGAFNNKSTRADELVTALFDEVVVSRVGEETGGVLENDTVGPDPAAILVTGPAHGTLTLSANGVFLYTPDPDFFGRDSFTYRAADATGTSSPALVTIEVGSVNDRPAAGDDSYQAQEEATLLVSSRLAGVLGNDTDIEGDSLTAVIEDTVGHGSLTLNPDGTFRYDPAPDFFGTDSFTYRADDGTDRSEPATVTIAVANRPDPPAAEEDHYVVEENQTLAVTEAGGGPGVAEDIVDYGSVWKFDDSGTDLRTAWREPDYDDRGWGSGPAELGYGDGDEATTVDSGPANNANPTTYFRRTFPVAGAAHIAACRFWIRRDDGCVVYLNGTEIGRSNLGANPAYTTYAETAADDGNSEIEFAGVDSALFVEGDNTLAVEIHQGSRFSSDISFDLRMEIKRRALQGVLANDTDPDGLPLVAVPGTGPEHGTLSLHPDGTFSYTPALNYEGDDSFTYFADNGSSTTEATARITVRPGPNDLPETEPDRYAPVEDTVFVRTAGNGVLANDLDPDGDPVAAVPKSPPSHGSLQLNGDGSFTYVPVPNFFGADTFTYAAFDGTAESPPQTVTLDVVNTPDSPVSEPDSYATNPGENLFVSPTEGVLANDFDPDRTSLVVELVTAASSGSVTLFPPGSFFFVPADGSPGVVTFAYRASDGVLTSPPTTVTIHLDSAPEAEDDNYAVDEDKVLSMGEADGLLRNDTDAENDPLTASLIAGPAHGTVSLNPNGSFTYQPEADFSGFDSFTYLADDGARRSAPATVSLTVRAVNDPPTAEADSYLAIDDVTLEVDASAGVLANDEDVDSVSLTATVVVRPRHGTLVLEADGSFTYEASPGFTGTDTFSYQAGDGSLSSLPATVTIQVGGASESIVINEIMYHPPSELDSHEFIELANIGDGPVDLNGWSFSSGLAFTFPEVTIPAGGFLVVASDPAAFTDTYGAVANLVGGWIGSLSNRGERLKLVDANGEEVDDLEYSDQGEWAVRTRVMDTGEPGWEWEAAHDGGGPSLELVNPRLTNKAGQNWLPSDGAPTPGAPNSVAASEADFAPMILDVDHWPRVPRSTDTVTIRASLRDTSLSRVSAVLHYRVSEASPAEFSTTAMADDGLHDDGEANDGLFGAALPARPDGTIIEFYLSATDGTNSRTWPAPTSIGQAANALYQVDDEEHPGGEGIYRLVLPVPENRVFNSIDRDSNAQMNCTLIADDCSGPVVRHLCGMRVRGASSRRDNPPPMRLNIPRDRPWKGFSAMNLNSQFPWLQFIGMKLFQASDLPAPDSKRVAVRRNGVDYATGTAVDFGSWVHLQPLGADLVDEKFPDDRQGNLYKKVRPDVDWAYRDGEFDRYPRDGWSKQTNASEDDWSDLDEFLRVVNEARGARNYLEQVGEVAHLGQWMRWFAVEALIANGETNVSNGADDDYSIYRGVADPRFVFLPHDLDTILGHGDGSRITNPQHTIFDMMEDDDILNPLVPLFSNPAIRLRYYGALRDLIETSFSKDRFDALVINHLGGWVPQGTIEDVIAFMDARRRYVSRLVEAELGPPPPRAAPTTIPELAGPRGNPFISEVLAANVAAHANAGKYPDYLELHNSGPVSISLAGYSLSDDPEEPRKFVFPAGSSIAPGQYLLLYADSETGDPGIHLGFGLNRGGESVSLYNAAGAPVDSVVYGPQVADFPIGRTGPGHLLWSLNQPTPGAPNVVQVLGSPATLRINEWLSKPDLVFEEDFIELYNPDPLPVSLGGLTITDDPLNDPQRAVLPALSFIAGNGHALFEAVGSDEATPGDSSELPFKLSADHGWIAIYGANGVEIDRVHALCDGRDQSQGRATDGATRYANFELPTPGLPNSTDLRAESAILRSLRITEIMYHPAAGGSDAEFIELRNTGDAPIKLLGVSFTKGISFDFPDMVLVPGEYVVVVADQAVFQSIYGAGVKVAGEWSGKLDNDDDHLRLEIDRLNAGILDFTYRDYWYPSTDGDGYSMIVIDDFAEPRSWEHKQGWTAGGVMGGTPGTGDGFFVFAGSDQVIDLPAAATLDATVLYGGLDPQSVFLAWSLENGPAAAEIGSPNNEDTTVSVPMAGRYTFELIASPPVGAARSALVTVEFRDTYENWATVHFGSPLDPAAGKLADHDLDGFANLLEFVLGLDPNVFESSGLLQPALEPGRGLSLTYFRRYVEADSVTITPEVSSDLKSWQQGPAFVSESVLASAADGEFVQAVDLLVPDGKTARFMRVRVEGRK